MTTVRTIKLKRNPQGSSEPVSLTESAPAEATQAEPTAVSDAPVVAAMPGRVTAGPVVSKKAYLPYVIAASLIVIACLVIMGLQYSEMSLYKAPPSVWAQK